MENFNMTLPSNASMEEFPSNAVAHYTTRLRDRIELNGQWEVSVVEASVPTRWSNIMSENFIRINLRIPEESEYVTAIPNPEGVSIYPSAISVGEGLTPE